MAEPIVESSTEAVLNVAKTKRIRVLHVDDDLTFLSISKQCLEKQGEIDVDTVSSVNEALGKLKKTDYDIIVSDYQMLGKDGLEFLKELRKKGNTVPFIVFTGKGREEIAVKALNLGALGYFTKQGQPETVYGELAHGIRQAVERKRASEALHESESKSRTLLENLPQKIFFKDKNSVYISCNENYARDLKIKSDEIAGRTDHDFYPKELAEKYRADDKKIMKSGNPEDIEEEYAHDGQKAFVHTVKTPVKDEKGNAVGILGIFWDITERKRGEDALRQSKENFESLAENAFDGLLVGTQGGVHAYANKRAAEITGYTVAELLRTTINELVHPDESEKMLERYRRRIEGRAVPNPCETVIIAKDGRSVPIELTGTRTIWQGNSADLVFFRDITERKKAEEALLKAEEKYRLFVRNLQGIAYRGDTGFNADFFNGPIKEITGYSEEELLKGKIRWDKLIHEEDSARILNCVKESISNKQRSGRLEYRIVRKDGTVKWIRQMFKHLFDDSGEVTGSQGILYDITEEKKTEEALRQSEERYRELAESISDVFFAMDKDFRYTYWNEASEKLTGISAKDAIGKSLTVVFPDVKGTKVEQIYREALRTNQPQSHLNKYQLGGKDYVFEINAYPTKTGLSVFVKDITERRKAEQSLKESEEKYRSLVELAPDGIVAVNAEGIVTSTNRSFLTLVGYDSGEGIVGKPFTELVTMRREDIPRFQGMFMSLMKGESPSPMEFLYVRKDGTSRWAEVHPGLLIKDGNPVGVQAIMRDVTERKNAEEKLRSLKEFNERTIDSISDSLLVIDPNDYRIISVNEAALKQSKSRKEDLIGKTCYEATHHGSTPCTPPHDVCPIQELLKTGKPVTIEHKHFDEHNNKTSIEVTVHPVKDKEGKTVQVVHIAKDITERKQAEDALRSSAEDWKRTFDSIPDLVYILDTDFRFVRVNKATCDALKKEPRELIGKRCFEVLHGTDEPWPNCPYEKMCTRDTKEATTEEVNDPNLGFPLLVTVSPIFGDNGKFAGIVHVAKDITNLKDTEEHLKKTNKRLEMIYENAMEGISIVDPKGNFVFVNKASANLLGYDKNDLIGMNLSKIFDKEGLEKIRNETEKRKKGKSERYELVFHTRDGEQRVARVSGSPIWEEDGTFAGTEAIVMDITSQKKAEEELCRAMEKLGVMNEKLRVVGGLTRHDVNNKLAAITGNAYLARKKLPGNSEVLDYLKQIEASVEQTVRIFDFARAYEMLGVEELAYVDVEKTVDEAVSLFPSLKGIKVTNDCHGLTVLADSLLRQLVYNLVDNSLKYGEKLSLIRVYYEEKNDHLNLIYEDDGVGISQAAKPKLFDEGYTTGKGSGYGLYLTKRMLEVYSWTIEEKGELGKGAKFVITIPKANLNGKENY
jgi:PAS domain S-box-containing protein